MANKLPTYFNPIQLDYHPKYEWALGNRIQHPETTKRAESIFRELKRNEDLFDIIVPPHIPFEAISDSHSYQLITLYNTAQSLDEDTEFYPSVFPQRMKAKPDPTNINNAGFYCFDSGTPLNSKTMTAASWSAACAYHAALDVKNGKHRSTYALSRPPGHHASKDTYGGYCYLNNAAIAAKVLRKKGRVVIVDIDFHHGNGTQDIFYGDDKVFFISIHGDPRNYFPFFCGHPSELGKGKAEGLNLNVILQDEADIKIYRKTLKQVVFPAIKQFNPNFLVISAGLDTCSSDPIGNFSLETDDYLLLGKDFARLELPTVIVQEGGYDSKTLGKNVVSFLKAFI